MRSTSPAIRQPCNYLSTLKTLTTLMTASEGASHHEGIFTAMSASKPCLGLIARLINGQYSPPLQAALTYCSFAFTYDCTLLTADRNIAFCLKVHLLLFAVVPLTMVSSKNDRQFEYRRLVITLNAYSAWQWRLIISQHPKHSRIYHI